MLRLIPGTFIGTSIVRKKRNGSGVAQSEFEKADEFNGQFTKTQRNQVPLLDRSAPFMEETVVTKEGVTNLLKGLNPSKVLGPDEPYPIVLKELATYLGPVLAHLFQQSLEKSTIYDELERVITRHISPQMPTSCVTSVWSKLFCEFYMTSPRYSWRNVSGSCAPVRVYATLVRVLRYVYKNNTTFPRHVYEFLRVSIARESLRLSTIYFDM